DGDLARADVDEPAPQEDDGHDEHDEADDEVRHELKQFVVHSLSFCAGSSSPKLPAVGGFPRRAPPESLRRASASLFLRRKPAPERFASEESSQYSASMSERSSSALASSRRPPSHAWRTFETASPKVSASSESAATRSSSAVAGRVGLCFQTPRRSSASAGQARSSSLRARRAASARRSSGLFAERSTRTSRVA